MAEDISTEEDLPASTPRYQYRGMRHVLGALNLTWTVITGTANPVTTRMLYLIIWTIVFPKVVSETTLKKVSAFIGDLLLQFSYCCPQNGDCYTWGRPSCFQWNFFGLSWGPGNSSFIQRKCQCGRIHRKEVPGFLLDDLGSYNWKRCEVAHNPC